MDCYRQIWSSAARRITADMRQAACAAGALPGAQTSGSGFQDDTRRQVAARLQKDVRQTTVEAKNTVAQGQPRQRWRRAGSPFFLTQAPWSTLAGVGLQVRRTELGEQVTSCTVPR